MHFPRIRDDELQVLRPAVQIHIAADAQASGHKNSHVSCRRNANLRRPIQIDARSDVISGMQRDALVLLVEVQSPRRLGAQRQRYRDRRNGNFRQPRGGVVEQRPFDNAFLDDHTRRAYRSMGPGISASISTQSRVIGIHQRMFR